MRLHNNFSYVLAHNYKCSKFQKNIIIDPFSHLSYYDITMHWNVIFWRHRTLYMRTWYIVYPFFPSTLYIYILSAQRGKVTTHFTIIQMLKTKLPPSKITVPAFAFENIPVGGEHRLVPLTVQTDGLHDGQWVPATLTVVVEGSVQNGTERDPRLCLGLGAESLTPCQENVLDEKQKKYYIKTLCPKCFLVLVY